MWRKSEKFEKGGSPSVFGLSRKYRREVVLPSNLPALLFLVFVYPACKLDNFQDVADFDFSSKFRFTIPFCTLQSELSVVLSLCRLFSKKVFEGLDTVERVWYYSYCPSANGMRKSRKTRYSSVQVERQTTYHK